jgi:hypothetical protein
MWGGEGAVATTQERLMMHGTPAVVGGHRRSGVTTSPGDSSSSPHPCSRPHFSSWAWFVHFWQDVWIFSFLAAGHITAGGGHIPT